MAYNPNKHHRRSIRLKGYDYSQAGLYFITICIQDRQCLFGEIINGEMILNNAGKMVENEWLKIRERFANVQLHEYVVMPNHFHAILEIVGATLVVAQNRVHPVFPEPFLEKPVQNETIVNDFIADIKPQDIKPQDIKPQDIQPQDGQPQDGQPQGIAPTGKPKTVGNMVGAFQSITTVEYIRGVKQLGWQPFRGKLWQRNYWEHIIRNEQSYQRISEYIINNPKNWKDDKFY